MPRHQPRGARAERAGAAAARVDPLVVRTGWFAEAEVLWLDPEPAAPFVAHTEAIARPWPEAQPYGGV
ncbi:MAG: hypothetical protein ACTHJ6_03150 [Oryzihumus sp.]